MLTIHRNAANMPKPATTERAIVARFRNPSRMAGVIISNEAWRKLESVPETYRGLLDAVLEKAAKDVLSTYLSSFGTWPSELNPAVLSEDKILEQASSGNSEWLSKEDLETAWAASATRRRFITDPRFATNAAYKKAVKAFEDLILKLAGKTSSYEPHELDKMLAKLDDDDLTSEFGMFAVRRIEAIRSKPQKVKEADLDLL